MHIVNIELVAPGDIRVYIYYSETGCTVFRHYISSVMPTAQEVSGGWEKLHYKYGDIHCATVAQRELDLTEPWWKQLDDWE